MDIHSKSWNLGEHPNSMRPKSRGYLEEKEFNKNQVNVEQGGLKKTN